ncbi:hypothetical protein DFH11DRAFT_1639063, partial [Phellopilus nigrolimitatus]
LPTALALLMACLLSRSPRLEYASHEMSTSCTSSRWSGAVVFRSDFLHVRTILRLINIYATHPVLLPRLASSTKQCLA